MPRSLRFKEIGNLADELMTAIKRVIPIWPISLVVTIIMKNVQRGLSAAEVESRTNRLIEVLRLQGAPIHLGSVSRVENIINALNMLKSRRRVTENEGIYKAVGEEYDILAYYANSIVHWLPNGQKPM